MSSIKPTKRKRHRWRRIVVTAVTVAIVFFAIAPLFLVQYVYERVFGVRVDHRTTVVESQMDDFDDLIREPYQFMSDMGQKLAGYEYTSKEPTDYKGLVVLSHGVGCGHIDYLFDIEHFVRSGYKVFAYDNTGCNDSEGDNLVGLKQSAIDLRYALSFLQSTPEFMGLPVFLYGHSWGGYAVTSVLSAGYNIKAVAARSAFNESQDMLLEQGRAMMGDIVDLLSPYLYLYERMKFGVGAPGSGINGINSVDIPIMLLHSRDDDVISYGNSLLYKSAECKNQSRITTVLFENKGHDLVRSDAAIAHIRDCAQRYSEMMDGYTSVTDVPSEVSSVYFSSVDVKLSNELDEGVMQLIVDFFDKAL